MWMRRVVVVVVVGRGVGMMMGRRLSRADRRRGHRAVGGLWMRVMRRRRVVRREMRLPRGWRVLPMRARRVILAWWMRMMSREGIGMDWAGETVTCSIYFI
ncbi:hypothetical protein F5144DRAFT_566370 [Chaetomium tenue]|uniref:Uncharacterized protein n=1 Tax=Chaetomium tenue TaxID=1854479 RepID=A0ACB7PCS0_9PEZI|nr:hypothetical protein F5144DRAFT_566370 [Chaetomium globosum]